MTKKYIHFDNRVVDYHFGIFENFNCTRGYQKLADKLEMKSIRTLGWLRTGGFLKSINDDCWNARYNMKR